MLGDVPYFIHSKDQHESHRHRRADACARDREWECASASYAFVLHFLLPAQQWQHATEAMRATADFGGKGRALEALRRMSAGRMGEDKSDAEAIAQVTGDAATLRAVLHGLAKEG